MPIIRREIYRFADLWNTHTIRYQRGRPNLPTGKPIILYHHPDPPAQSYAILPCPDTLKLLQQDVYSYGKFRLLMSDLCAYRNYFYIDPDEYLPKATQEWCLMQLNHIGIQGPITSSMKYGDGIPTHRVAYLYLREMGNNFIRRGGDLTLSVKPTGTYSWVGVGEPVSEVPNGIVIDLDIDQHLDEMDSIDISPELYPEMDGLAAGSE